MSRHKLVRAISTAMVLAAGAAGSYSTRQARAQETTPEVHCYLVVCVGNVCTYQEIKCPETKPAETPTTPQP